ncbi:MAG: SIS domain-containing protein [Magnetococcales bacterium]|nr:SIS domain-containing protein [Magnetococcales bacterium]
MPNRPATVATARVTALLQRSIDLKQQVLTTEIPALTAQMAIRCADSIAAGGKILMCGNGGSAADAQHLAAELLVRLRPEVNRQGVPALALALDTSSMTACGNDYSYEVFYARMTRALGRPGDVLLGITTSGNSPNVIEAMKTARGMGIVTMGLLGGQGGQALPWCDLAIVVPSKETGRIQEVHITVGHALMEAIEDLLLDRGALTRL